MRNLHIAILFAGNFETSFAIKFNRVRLCRQINIFAALIFTYDHKLNNSVRVKSAIIPCRHGFVV